jgi:hypothetical protein
MSAGSLDNTYEAALLRRMKACAAELDKAASPAPPLRAVLASTYEQPTSRPMGRPGLRFALPIGAIAIAIAFAFALAGPVLQGHGGGVPLSPVTPGAIASPCESPIVSPSTPSFVPLPASPRFARPCPSPSLASAPPPLS